MIWRKDSVCGLAVLVEILLLDFSSLKILQACQQKLILAVLHYFSGILSFLLNIHGREVKAFPTALSSASVTPICDLGLVGTMSTELGCTRNFIPAVVEINVKLSSGFSIS